MPIIAAMIGRSAPMPSALKNNSRWHHLGDAQIPALLVHPDWSDPNPAPVIIWMHGRTAHKELDPGRYLRWMRAGIAACAVDLPGHGERLDATLQQPEHSFAVVRQMMNEIDQIAAALMDMQVFDMQHVGIGGASAGGMAALARLCRPHSFVCASVEATAGSWKHQQLLGREMFRDLPDAQINELNPIERLDTWRVIPFQAIHSTRDEWVSIDGQIAFIEALRQQYRDPTLIEFVQYDRTGAAHEHIGFGLRAADAKDRQRDFFRRWLNPGLPAAESVLR